MMKEHFQCHTYAHQSASLPELYVSVLVSKIDICTASFFLSLHLLATNFAVLVPTLINVGLNIILQPIHIFM